MMQSMFFSLRRLDKNTIREWVLIALWIAGSSLGLWAASLTEDAYASFLQPLAGSRPELGGVFASAIMPLLLSACGAILFGSAGCYAMCLFRSVSQGFLLGLIRVIYGAAAPLVALLLVFSGVAVNGLLLYFWMHRLRLGAIGFRREFCLLLVGCVAVAAADYLMIGPFLADVMIL